MTPTGPARVVRLVGPFTVEGLGGSGPGGQEARLLKRLAISPDQNVPMPALVDALWSADATPARAERNIAALVSRLRKTLGQEAIRGDVNGYCLVVSPDLRVDLHDAETRCGVAEEELAGASFGLAEHAAGTAESML
ncbi:MAG: helix-turn-helix domain-containing protein, partial [Nocardioides sp.]